jgi:hypothetical protein
MRHPNFILGLISVILLFVGIGFKANGYSTGDKILIVGTLLAGVHWIWGIIDVFKNQHVISQSKKFWIILVIALPVIGSMLYHSMSKTVKM